MQKCEAAKKEIHTECLDYEQIGFQICEKYIQANEVRSELEGQAAVLLDAVAS